MEVSNQFYQDVLTALQQHNLLKALIHLKAWISTLSNWELSSRFDEIFNAYQSLLHYYAEGFKDDKRFEMQEQFFRQTYSLNESTLRQIQLQNSNEQYFLEARKISQKNIDTLKTDLENKQQQLLFSELTGCNNSSYTTQQKEHEDIANSLFLYLWTSSEWSQNTYQSIQDIFLSNAITSVDKSLFVSALTLALNHTFDVLKFILLIHIYLSEKSETSERALVGIVFTSIIHHKLISSFVDHKTYTELNTSLDQLIHDEHFCNNIADLQLQLINEQDTEKTNQEIEKNIMPQIIKSGIKSNKIQIDDIEELLEGDNDSPLFDKDTSHKINDSIQHLITLQQNGADLYFSSFRHLKAFPFFYNISNWFLPFNDSQSDIASLLKNDSSLIHPLLESDSLCNSDIYSIILMFNGIPESQKQMMRTQIEAMLSEKLQKRTKTDIPIQSDEDIRKKYIQDCYRFFKLYRNRKEFINPFECDIILTRNKIFQKAFSTETIIKLAKFAAKQKSWTRMLAIINAIGKETNDDETLMLKGIALQNSGLYEEAAYHFEKAYIIKGYDERLARYTAHCLRITNQPQKATQIYAQLSENLPQDGKIAYYFGISLMNCKQYEAAAKQFQKSYYLKPDFTSSLRALAWTYLMLKETELAEMQYQKLLADKPNAEDFLNAGHTALISNNIKIAIQRYLSYHHLSASKSTLFSIPTEDIKKLQDIYGIQDEEIQLISDYINAQDI